uniref:Secreted protein n=1 Tax=Ananas comosus var. bracteatus TaxID=296719 RepID=A0A6V7PWY0_ANACO|nr:unnamed protein product [Ananas comosus var. bracteatus]
MKSSLKSFLVPLLTLAPLAISRSPNTLCSTAILILLAWRLATSLLHWLHPGGHAWGKYVSYRACERSSRPIIPGPRGVPFVGSMRLMSGLAHRRLDAVARCSEPRGSWPCLSAIRAPSSPPTPTSRRRFSMDRLFPTGRTTIPPTPHVPPLHRLRPLRRLLADPTPYRGLSPLLPATNRSFCFSPLARRHGGGFRPPTIGHRP